MLAMQRTKSKRGKKIKSKFVNVTCQTEATTTYLQYNKILRACSKIGNNFNRKRTLKIIREYFNEKQNNNIKKCSLIRYIKRKQKCMNASKTKSANSVIYIGRKKLKNKKALRNLSRSRRSIIYIGTTYNTLEATHDIIDLTQAAPVLKRTHKSNTTQKPTEQSLLLQHFFPKTTTKYYKRLLFNSISDSVLFVKSKEFCDLQCKYSSDYSVHMRKKFKPELIPNDRNICLKELMNIKLPQLSTINENDISRDSADISENADSDFLKINDGVPEIISATGNGTMDSINVIEHVLDQKVINGVMESFQDIADNREVVNEFENIDNPVLDIHKFCTIENNTTIAEVLNNTNKMDEYVGLNPGDKNLLQQHFFRDNGSSKCLVENVLPTEREEKLLDEVTNNQNLMESDENI